MHPTTCLHIIANTKRQIRGLKECTFPWCPFASATYAKVIIVVAKKMRQKLSKRKQLHIGTSLTLSIAVVAYYFYVLTVSDWLL